MTEPRRALLASARTAIAERRRVRRWIAALMVVALAYSLQTAIASALVARDPIAWGIAGSVPSVVASFAALAAARFLLVVVAPAWIAGECASLAWAVVLARSGARRRATPSA